MTNDASVDPFDFASTVDERPTEHGQQQGRQFGYQRGFRQGFSRGLDYALDNHREIATIAAHCEQLHAASDESDSRQKRLLHAIGESCREFRLLLPDQSRYAELLASIRARYQHITRTSSSDIDKPQLTF